MIRRAAELRSITDGWRAVGQRVGYVATLGGIHAGHTSLVRRAREADDRVVASVYLNPRQYTSTADLASYPRDEASDVAALEAAGVDVVWAPPDDEVYPEGVDLVAPDPGPVGAILEGASRPGHFAAVLLVVYRLLDVVGRCRTYFGEKDAQQLFLVRRMVLEHGLAVEVVACPTVRATDGLAMSSRNALLTPEEREQAGCLFLALAEAAELARDGERDARVLVATMAREIGRLDGVIAVGRGEISPGDDGWSMTHVELPGRADPVGVGTYNVDYGFFETLGTELRAGRTFSPRIALDDSTVSDEDDGSALEARGVNVIVSEAGARQLGFGGPEAAIGGQLRIGTVPATIVGVVDDVQYRSVREDLEPIMYTLTTAGHDTMLVRFDNEAPAEVMERIEAVWRRHVPDVPFEAEFAQDRVAELYRADEGRGQLFALFAGLAIVIGCLGLYALAAFTAERRTKEIGIRKVLGARTRDIVRLLVWQFLRPVAIANLIAWPVAWWVMQDWLSGFTDRIEVDPAWFVAAGALALAIATATIVGHAVRVSRTNPIHALRYE